MAKNTTNTSARYNELQAKYIRGVGALSKLEASEFLALVRDNYDDPFHDRRVEALERRLSAIKRTKDGRDAWEREWKAAAYEYKALTERWESVGASWRGVGDTLTIWEYDGSEFFRWWSSRNNRRALITDIIVEARKADDKLTEMISG